MSILRTLLGTPKFPPAARRSLKREQVNELTVPVAFAMLEGGFIGVITDKLFEVSPWVLAVFIAAPMFGSLSSFGWNRLATARPKVPLVVGIQVRTMLCLLMISLAPMNMTVTVTLVAGVIVARVLIVGMITTAVASPLLDANPENFRWMYIIATLIATGGIFSFSRIVVTGEKRHRVQERRLAKTDTTSAQPGFFSILKNHRHYAQYQLHQFLAGTANMMLEAPLIFLMLREMQASYTASIAISMIIPFGNSILTLPIWARYLNREDRNFNRDVRPVV